MRVCLSCDRYSTKPAVEVVEFVLDAHRQQALGVEFDGLGPG